MKIALLGAPDAGKSLTARRVARRLNDQRGDQKWIVIDSYAEKVMAKTGRIIGPEASYSTNIMIMTQRWLEEEQAARRGWHTITCGSLYETIVYAAILNTGPMLPNEHQEIGTQLLAQTLMNAFGALETLTFDYDAMFYLPYRDTKSEHNWNNVVNAKIPEILEGFFKYVITLTGTDRQRVDRVTEVTQFILDADATSTSDEQPTV